MTGQEDLPAVSVIVAMRNEERFIERCLDSLAEQDYPPELVEVLVVDGRSDDSSREIVKAKQKSMPNLSLLDNEKRISPVAFNIGVREARGAILTIISAHSYLAPDYIARCVEYLSSTDADSVGGPIQSVGNTDTARAIALAMSSPFGVGDALFRYSQEETYVDTLAFGAYRREVFERVGLFDEELVGSEDDEFNYRLRSAGGKLLLTPAIRSFYHGRASFGALCRQYFRYGLGKMRVVAKHPRLVRLRHFIPSLFVLALVASALLTLIQPVFALLLALGAGTYLVASLVISLRIASRYGWRFLPLVMVAFACLHLSYGTGFLLGIPRLLADKARRAR